MSSPQNRINKTLLCITISGALALQPLVRVSGY